MNDQRTEPLHALMFAVQMLVNTEKGDTFSFNEIKSWLGRCRIREGAQTRSTRSITIGSGNKTLGLASIAAGTCFLQRQRKG